MNIPKKQSSLYLNYLLLFLLCTVVYFKMYSAGFISWDDNDVLVKNHDVHDFNLKAFFTKNYIGDYAPFTMIVFALEWAVFHGSAFGHHLMSVLLHSICGILVFKLTLVFFKNKWWALFTSIVFCLHPLQVETVAWIAAKNNIICAIFFLTSLILYCNYKTGNSDKKHLVLSLLLFCGAALSKPSAICFPLCLFAVDLILEKKQNKRSLLEKIPFFIIALILGVITLYTREESHFLNSTHHFNIAERFGFAGYAILSYLRNIAAPFQLSVIYPYPQNELLAILVGYLTLSALGLSVFLLWRRGKKKLIGVIFFFIANLVLVLQLIPFGETLTTDRYMYIPIISVCWLILVMFKPSERVLKYGIVLCVFLCVPLTFLRTRVWKSSFELYTDILKKYPESPVAIASLGAEYLLKDETDKALSCFNKAIKLSPRNFEVYYNRGLLFSKNKKNKEAVADFSKAIGLNQYSKAYAARATTYYEERNYTAAISDAESALLKDANNVRAYYVLGNVYNDLNQLDKALKNYNAALAISPEEPAFYFKRAIVNGKLQHFANCLEDLDKSTTLDPEYAEAYYWKGVAKINLKQNPCEDLKKAVNLGFIEAQGPLSKYCR
jgi:tetratricopeptide (TPR) repeat protein